MRRYPRLLLGALLGVGCGDPLYLGSDVIWSANHESRDLGEWERDAGGGTYVDAYGEADTHAVVLASDAAHAGGFAAKLTRQSVDGVSGPGLFRDAELPEDAYYSAWYLVPAQYETISGWAIMKFRSKNPDDPAQLGEGLDLNLRSLPGGDYVLYVFDHDRNYLEAPVADPPPIVQVGRWFHLEVRLRVGASPRGAIDVWFDGRKTYELSNRTTAGTQGLYFSPCNITADVTPAPTSLYVDDVAISLERFTPTGTSPRV
jgi:hypothetical protein